MRDAGLEQAIKAAGGVASLARAIGIAQPSVSAWSRIPAERVLVVGAHGPVADSFNFVVSTETIAGARSPRQRRPP